MKCGCAAPDDGFEQLRTEMDDYNDALNKAMLARMELERAQSELARQRQNRMCLVIAVAIGLGIVILVFLCYHWAAASDSSAPSPAPPVSDPLPDPLGDVAFILSSSSETSATTTTTARSRIITSTSTKTVTRTEIGSLVTVGSSSAEASSADTVQVEHLQLQFSLQDVQQIVPENGISAPNQCSDITHDSEFYGVSATHFDHIPAPEMCCGMCHGILSCRSWTWVNANLSGCPYRCLMHTGAAQTRAKAGAVSGTPPIRPLAVLPPNHRGDEGLSLLCVSLIQPRGYEIGVVQLQHSLNISIFACDAYGVYSNRSMELAPGVMTGNIEIDMTCERGGDSYTALNTWVFIAFWNHVIRDGHYRSHDWTVKVDPDTVFFPARLRTVLEDHRSAAFLNNCRFGLHGPIEVLSRRAIERLREDYDRSEDQRSPYRCVTELTLGQWGEDMWLDQCLRNVYNFMSEIDERLLCEDHCECPDWYWCNNNSMRVSYHPFKRPDMYMQCLADSMAGTILPTAIPGTVGSPLVSIAR